MSDTPRHGPILFDLDPETQTQGPDTAPPVPEEDDAIPQGRAMQRVASLAAARPSRLVRWFWSLAALLVSTMISLAAWDYAAGLIARAPVLGYVMSALLLAMLALLMVMALRELAAFARLKRLDLLHRDAQAALAADDLGAVRQVIDRLVASYGGRDDTRWGRERLAERREDVFDAVALIELAEDALLDPLDQRAQREIEAAARQVATVTAIVPLALADVFAALTANLRMIRRIAEIYGGRSGMLGSWRLTRTVLTHLVATGAVAIGDDLIGTVAGGGLLGKLSRRFGEGVVNGALTARVGVAAMEVCRPLPFVTRKRPSVAALVQQALTGLFNTPR